MTRRPPACRSCGAELELTFADLGVTPLANSYLTHENLDQPEPVYPLHARVCRSCRLVQVDDVVPAEEIFADYAYFSSFSSSWLEHSRAFAEWAVEHFGLTGDSFVVEVASNDGYLLRNFVPAGIRVLGVEPAANVAEAARRAGVDTRVCFFSRRVAEDLRATEGAADLIVANNVLAHVPDLNDFVAGLASLLAEEGVVSIEVPHLLRLIQQTQFDTIYHEHFSYFSLRAAEVALGRHGLRVFDVHELDTHGGSLRLLVCHEEASRTRQLAVRRVRDDESAAGLDTDEPYRAFADRVHAVCADFSQMLREASEAGLAVAAYGAAAKGNTLLNVCGVGSTDLLVVADRSPHKQGKYLPGSRIPIVSPAELDVLRPDVLVILPWNLQAEIVEQLSHLRSHGTRFLVPIPEPRYLP